VNAVSRKSVVRQITARLAAVTRLPKAALFHLLNGRAIQQMLDAGALITTNTWLDAQGVPADFKDGYRSWYGRAVRKAYRATYGIEPIKAWVQHRTSGRWIKVNAYAPSEQALITGAKDYARTSHLVAAAPALQEVA
jgi:hypothetical protein